MGYYNPDLVGDNPAYAVENDTYVIYQTNQQIIFDGPVFLNSISIQQVSTVNVPLFQGTDWSYAASDIDVTETAKMKTYDPAFSAVLVDSITINRPITGQITISLNYQKLYPVTYKSAVFDNQRVDFTPDLVVDILNRISNVELLTGRVPNNFANSNITPKFFQVDLTGTSPDNLVTNEVYNVNVLQKNNIICPVNGSFYKDSVQITLNDGNNTPLTKDVDYQIFGLDVAKTKTTDNTSGVYNFIVITRAYVGEVFLNCQVYGGVVTLSDMISMYEMVQNIDTYLNNTSFVTTTSVSNTPVLQNVLTRMGALEDKMRALINSGNPTYGDVTGNGTTMVYKFQSTDNSFHWWDIASLYKVDGSSQVITADRMCFRMQLSNSKIMADIFATVDLNLSNTSFTVDSIAVSQDIQTAPVIMPEFRIVYNNSVGTPTGVTLQIGLSLPSLTETIAIEDRSGVQSCWKLLPASSAAVLPQDTTIMLPDGVSVWDTTNQDSVSIAHMMPNRSGYVAWTGSESLQALSSVSTLTSLLPQSFLIADIDSILLKFLTGNGSPVELSIPVSKATSSPGTVMVGSGYIPSASPGGSPILITTAISIVNNQVNLTVSPEPTASNLAMILTKVMVSF